MGPGAVFAKSLAHFKGFSTINAKAETVTTKALWRGPFEPRRCLVPADGFYEWKKPTPRQSSPTPSIVRSFGYSVRTAEDGFVALKILREVLPDMIISDLRMPGMSGFELLSVVRRRFPHIPTIAISGEYILATMPLGLLVDHFFQKGGYTPQQLRDKMKEVIAESPIRPHLGKQDICPLWIPRVDANYLVVTCAEYLRSSSIADSTVSEEVPEADCLACGAPIRYLVDSSILKVLEHKRSLVPAF